jgi:hypothetical protein
MSRYKTGEKAPDKGNYIFDGYVSAPAGTKAPTENEKNIPLDKNETFPPIKSTSQGAYWVKKK